MAKKKSSKTFWIVIAVIAVALGALVVSQSGGPDIDYSQYDYADEAVEQGWDDASHTITEYADFQCPYCGQTAPVIDAVKKDFDVNVDYKHFPLTQIHPYAQLAAEASECARDQGRFWAYHDVLFDHQDRLAKAYLLDYAEGLGLDMDSFETCMDEREKQTVVASDVLEGRQRGVSGTPTIYIDGEQVPYRTYQQFANHFEEQSS